jgi:hypothetical protein
MKKVGVVVDNYKLEVFKNELRAKGWIIKTSPFTKDTTTIQVDVADEEVVEV